MTALQVVLGLLLILNWLDEAMDTPFQISVTLSC